MARRRRPQAENVHPVESIELRAPANSLGRSDPHRGCTRSARSVAVRTDGRSGQCGTARTGIPLKPNPPWPDFQGDANCQMCALTGRRLRCEFERRSVSLWGSSRAAAREIQSLALTASSVRLRPLRRSYGRSRTPVRIVRTYRCWRPEAGPCGTLLLLDTLALSLSHFRVQLVG
jgi:hypothetical protein